jgi:hypothetical protein
MASTTTTNLQLFKATPGTAEDFRRGQDVNANWDKVDSAIGLPYSDVVQSTVGNTTSEGQLMAAGIGAPALQGSAWEMEACGGFAHSATSTTLTIRAKLGGAAFTWVITTPASALSNRLWRLNTKVYCLTTGPSGTWKLSGLGVATVNTVDTPTLLSTTVTKDTSTLQTLEITAQWGAANAANTISCDAGYIKRLTNA